MRNIRDEIRQNMTVLEASGKSIKASFSFPAEFIGFQGHFPGNKILPAVCQIQCVVAMLETWKRENVMLKEIVHAKFILPVLPADRISCELRDFDMKVGEVALSALFHRNGEKVSELRLRVCIAGGKVEA